MSVTHLPFHFHEIKKMNDLSTIYYSLAISTALILLKIYKDGLKDLITVISLFYFYFSFGPVINYLLGYNIYFGIPHSFIPEACLIFTTALATLVLGSFFWPAKKAAEFNHTAPELGALIPIYIFSILYAIAAAAVVVLGGASNKIDKIALAIPALHYNYLMIQIYLISFYFLVKETGLKKLFYLNTLTYIIYSLVIGERDFIFPIISILFHRFIFQTEKKSSIKLMLSMGLLMILATGIFFVRDASQNSGGLIEAVLNQGSLLFVNSFSLKLLAERIDYMWGYTYLNSLLNLLPNWIYKTDFNTLDWFKNSYASTSSSGYGFGLDAEGFLNFSYLGVIISFLVILFIQRKTAKHLGGHPFFTYYSVFFCAFTMYSLRNDSLAFMKGNLYGILFFFLVYKLSPKRKLP